MRHTSTHNGINANTEFLPPLAILREESRYIFVHLAIIKLNFLSLLKFLIKYRTDTLS